jgi:hypothetical protein
MSSENHTEWRLRIAEVQRQRMTPEQLQRMKEMADRQMMVVKARATSYNMQKKSNGLRKMWATGVSALSDTTEERHNAPLSASVYMERCELAQQEMEAVSKEIDEEEEKEALSEYLALQNSAGSAVSGEDPLADNVGAKEADDEVEAALEQLKAFPSNDQEEETKFKVEPLLALLPSCTNCENAYPLHLLRSMRRLRIGRSISGSSCSALWTSTSLLWVNAQLRNSNAGETSPFSVIPPHILTKHVRHSLRSNPQIGGYRFRAEHGRWR